MEENVQPLASPADCSGKIRSPRNQCDVTDVSRVPCSLQTISVIQVTVIGAIVLIWLVWITPADIDLRHNRQSDAMRPRIITGQIDIPFAPGGGKQETVIPLGSTIIETGHIAQEIRCARWIRQLKNAALIDVRRTVRLERGALRSSNSDSWGVLDGNIRNQDGRIKIDSVSDAYDLSADVGSGSEQARRDLSLDRQVPRVLLCRFDVRLERIKALIQRKRRESRVSAIEREREWVSTRKVAVWIIEIDRSGPIHRIAERSDCGSILMDVLSDEIVCRSCTGADGRFPITERIPRDHRSCWNKIGHIAWRLANQSALVPCEEKQLVLFDGPADYSPELIAFQLVTSGSEKVSTVQNRIAKEFESV